MKAFARIMTGCRCVALLFFGLPGTVAAASAPQTADIPRPQLVTNAAQFKTLSGADFLTGCDCRLIGVITMVDTNRELVVLQDATGAVALHFRMNELAMQAGRRVVLEGENCVPYYPAFPDFPLHPSEQCILDSFEYPTNANPYRLTRLRGYLCPPVTGEYHFWIASDNSSELWLSANANPTRAKRIANIQRYGWVAPREWGRLPSQHSEPVWLNAGERYYIEALLEQTTGDEHVSVAWRGPGLNQSLIESRFLIPWRELGGLTNGILRECWTNYTAGDLAGLAGAREFHSALSLPKVRVTDLAPGQWPTPVRIHLGQRLPQDGNYRWVRVEGTVRFVGLDENAAALELSDEHGRVQVRAMHWKPERTKQSRAGLIRVEGVCEGATDQNGLLTPGRIWATAKGSISRVETAATNADIAALDPPAAQSALPSYPDVQAYFGMRGVVTFNDRLWGSNYLVVQKDAKVVLVDFNYASGREKLKVGTWLDIGGELKHGNDTHIPVVVPLVAKDLGWHSTPMPPPQQITFPIPAAQEGRWSEFEGVVHSVNSNGTLTVVGTNGTINLWPGRTPPEEGCRWVDARLRARGVLLSTLSDGPLLLAPSRNFLDVEARPPDDPFAARRCSIAALRCEAPESPWPHRVRVVGEITYRDEQFLFVQDDSAAIRVRNSGPTRADVGESVEVIGFPAANDLKGILVEAQLRRVSSTTQIKSQDLDLSDALSPKQNGMLVHVSASLLAVKTNGPNQVLELQGQHRIFTAMLPGRNGSLPDITPGSRIRLTGVCNDETSAASLTVDKPPKSHLLSSINILLRGPRDVHVLSGPPWWTWKRTATLVGTLLTILAVTLSWVHLLQRRLERQKAAQLAFSRQVLERLEDERRRIAVNLHDSLGQTLMVIKNHAMLAIQTPSEESGLQHRLDEISGATSQALEEVRQITHGLRPYQLDRLGLTQAIRASVDRASTASECNSILFATLVEDIDGVFDKDAEIHVYRIVQEAVTNVVKHSAATEAAVVIKKRSASVSLSVRDNGRGFDLAAPNARPHGLGYGLSGIAERSRILGATITIDSSQGSGTSLTVEVPLPPRRP